MIILTAYRQEQGLLSVTMGRGFYRVDNMIHEITEYQQEVILEESSVIMGITRIEYRRVVNSYLNVETNEKVSVLDYETQKANLNALCVIDEDGDRVFPDQESQLKYDTFCKIHTPIYTTVEEENPVAVNINGEYLREHPFIIAKRKLGEKPNNTLYQLNVPSLLKARLIEHFEKHGYKNLGYSPSTFGSIKEEGFFYAMDTVRWAKLYTPVKRDGVYLSSIFPSLREILERENFVLSGTFEELEAKVKFYESEIERQCALYFNANKPITSVKSIGEIYNDLNSVISLIGELDVMKKSTTTYEVLRKMSRELRVKLEEACKEMK